MTARNAPAAGERGHPTVEQYDEEEAREALLAAIERRYPRIASVLRGCA